MNDYNASTCDHIFTERCFGGLRPLSAVAEVGVVRQHHTIARKFRQE